MAGNTVYCSGIMGVELDSLEFAVGGAGPQAAKALQNLRVLLEESGSSLSKVVKTTVLLADMNDYNVVNDEYRKGVYQLLLWYFGKVIINLRLTVFADSFPARSCYAVNKLPRGAAVEIEAIALIGDVIHTTTKLSFKM